MHAGNKTELLKMLTKRSANLKGIIDEDPLSHQPTLLSKFKERQNLTRYGIKIFHQKDENNLLIMLCPRLEDWILKAAHETNINLKKYGLPGDSKKLHEQINVKTENFQKLINDMRAKSERLKKLKQHLLHGIKEEIM